jgi:ribose 5-phosphate isomerase B
METIALGADHGGYQLKEIVKKYLSEQKDISILDLGTHSEASVDYPEYGAAVAKAIASGKAQRGIVVCGTGIGISIAANKIKGIRAANCTSPFMAEMSRRHNNANVLALGERISTKEQALEIVKVWLDTPFEGGRHERRVKQISDLENQRQV